MKIVPLSDKIVVRRFEAQEKTDSGLIYKPVSAQDKPLQGEVVAVGRGLLDTDGKLHEPTLKTGDKVIFGAYSGSEVEVGGEKFLIMREGDVFGVLED